MRPAHPLLPTIALTLVLSACGSIEASEGAASGEAATAPPAASAATSEPASGPITMTDARGEQIALDTPASDVVGLEWGVVENLVSLDVMPVGVADVTGYTKWVSAAPLEDDVEDVGTRGEPSVDALVALDPDLVITTTDLPANLIEQIEQLVPVLVVRGADAQDPIGQMRDNLEITARAVGRTDEAAALLDHFDAVVAEGGRQIEDAGLAGAAFTMADSWMEGSSVSIRMFTDGSLVGAIGEELGLRNAWNGEGDPDYGLAQTDVEGLTALDDVEFIYYANDEDGGDAFEQGLAGNAIWDSLPFVRNGNVHRLPDGIWMFGGPLSTEQFIAAAVEAVTS